MKTYFFHLFFLFLSLNTQLYTHGQSEQMFATKQNAASGPVSTSAKKKVTFFAQIFVILIPTCKEYDNAGLKDVLWWNKLDSNRCKKKFESLTKIYLNNFQEANKLSKKKLANAVIELELQTDRRMSVLKDIKNRNISKTAL